MCCLCETFPFQAFRGIHGCLPTRTTHTTTELYLLALAAYLIAYEFNMFVVLCLCLLFINLASMCSVFEKSVLNYDRQMLCCEFSSLGLTWLDLVTTAYRIQFAAYQWIRIFFAPAIFKSYGWNPLVTCELCNDEL